MVSPLQTLAILWIGNHHARRVFEHLEATCTFAAGEHGRGQERSEPEEGSNSISHESLLGSFAHLAYHLGNGPAARRPSNVIDLSILRVDDSAAPPADCGTKCLAYLHFLPVRTAPEHHLPGGPPKRHPRHGDCFHGTKASSKGIPVGS